MRVKPAHGIETPEEHDAIRFKNVELGFYAWLLGTLGFTAVELWAKNGRTTFSMAVRKVFVTKHPVGRAALAGGMTLLYAHLVRQKALQGLPEQGPVRR